MSGIGHYAASAPDTAAIVWGGTSLTFGALEERLEKLAGAMLRGGVGRRGRVAVLSTNRSEVLEVVAASLRAGIVPVPINPLLTSPEVTYLLEDSGARWLFTDRAAEQVPGLERIVTFGDAYERLLYDSDPVALAPHLLGRPMHYTSGTTGEPKGVWAPPLKPPAAARVSDRFIHLWGLVPEDAHLVCSPLAHSAPLRYSLRTLEAGGTVVLQIRFEAEETLASIDLMSITSTFMVPTHLERIMSLTRPQLARYDVSSIRLLAHAGAPIRETTKQAAIDLFPKGSVWEFYGSTEGQATRISTEEWLERPGSVGMALEDVKLSVRSDDGSPQPAGEVGEVWVAGRSGERWEYWGDRSKTAAAWSGDAFSVGDLGWLDEDGYLYLTGRKHETIISGGVNVYPQEVERVLREHPAVAEVIVYGVDDPEWGQEVRAAVTAQESLPLDPELLRRWARERLAGFKCPKQIDIVEELPRTPTGKLRRVPPP